MDVSRLVGLTLLTAIITTPTLAQDTPGHGADEMTSESLKNLDAMKAKPHGLLMNTPEMGRWASPDWSRSASRGQLG